MLTRSQRRPRQISNEQEGRDVTDEAPSVDGEGTDEPTAMSDGGDANANGSRSSHLSPLTGSETSEEAARWLAGPTPAPSIGTGPVALEAVRWRVGAAPGPSAAPRP